MSIFKVGDIVEPTDVALKIFKGNNFGKKVGVVTHTDFEARDDYEYRVEWEGGRPAHYDQRHLSLHRINLENK